MIEPFVSVLVGSRNPIPAYLARVFDALARQTLSPDHWELILVDNLSEPPIRELLPVFWQARARVVVEPRLGHAFVRERAIRESSGEILVFVDDDNVISDTYLETAIDILQKNPFLGCIGGSSRPVYERFPGEWIRPYQEALATSEVKTPVWANFKRWSHAFPFGAGMAFRRPIGMAFCELDRSTPPRSWIGTKGRNTMTGEDDDLVLCGVAAGYGYGRFPQLSLDHLIAPHRCNKAFMTALVARLAAQGVVRDFLWNNAKPKQNSLPRDTAAVFAKTIHAGVMRRRVEFAKMRAMREIKRALSEVSKSATLQSPGMALEADKQLFSHRKWFGNIPGIPRDTG